jgi:hypothetical protein
MRWTPKKLAQAALAGAALVFALPAIHSAGLDEGPEGSAAAKDRAAVAMKHYRNSAWDFTVDVPASWRAFPASPALSPDDVSSPYQLVRFSEKGDRTLMGVFRAPHDPSAPAARAVKQTEAILAKAGFSDFTVGETTIGARSVQTLDCQKRHPGGKVWRVRAYLIADGSVLWTLGFAAADRETMLGPYDRVARSFQFGAAG